MGKGRKCVDDGAWDGLAGVKIRESGVRESPNFRDHGNHRGKWIAIYSVRGMRI